LFAKSDLSPRQQQFDRDKKCRDFSAAAFSDQGKSIQDRTLGSIPVSISSHKALAVNFSKITEPGFLEVMRPLRVVTATVFGVTLTRLYSVLVTLMKSGL